MSICREDEVECLSSRDGRRRARGGADEADDCPSRLQICFKQVPFDFLRELSLQLRQAFVGKRPGVDDVVVQGERWASGQVVGVKMRSLRGLTPGTIDQYQRSKGLWVNNVQNTENCFVSRGLSYAAAARTFQESRPAGLCDMTCCCTNFFVLLLRPLDEPLAKHCLNLELTPRRLYRCGSRHLLRIRRLARRCPTVQIPVPCRVRGQSYPRHCEVVITCFSLGHQALYQMAIDGEMQHASRRVVRGDGAVIIKGSCVARAVKSDTKRVACATRLRR